MLNRSITLAFLIAASTFGFISTISATSSQVATAIPIQVKPAVIADEPADLKLASLTGRWRSDDGGTYYLRQIGDQLWWYGESRSTNPGWSNVLIGTIENGEITARWTDVPKGGAQGVGSMKLRIVSRTRIEAISKSGSPFLGSVWQR